MNVSTTFLYSLKQDINILNRLIENISKDHKDLQLKSWFFPSESYDFVTKIVNSKSFKNASYQNHLEITVDRLYVVIRLIILSIDRFNFKKSFKINKLIISPSRLTVGYCVKFLWARISEIMEKEANKTTNSSDNQECCDKEVQTDIISLNKCDSCSSAMLCMKNLLNFFERTQDSKERLKIKYKIFDITQFGCMLKVTSSIEDSLNMLFKQRQENKMENDLLKLENEKYKSELQVKDRKIAFFEAEVDVLRGKLVNDNQEILILRQETTKLAEENYLKQDEIKNLYNIKDNLITCLSSIKQENKILKGQNVSLIRNIDTSMRLLSQYGLKLNKRITVLDTEYDVVKRIIDQYEKSINCLNIKLVKLTKNLEKIDLKVKYRYNCMDEVLQGFLKYDGFCVKIKEIFKEKVEYFMDSNEKQQEAIKFKGNPIEDFTKQIEENKIKIKDLENENIKLQQLLARFKNIKPG